MIIVQSLISLLCLLAFFSLLGLGVCNNKTAKTNLALVPIFGYAALIGLSYVISANFKLTGANAVGCAIIILLSGLLFKLKNIPALCKEIWRNGELAMFFAVLAVPIFSIMLPALVTGFKYFYAFVNYDFFYNSQDSWLLQTHNVIQYNINNATIVPLDWSANFSGRIAVGLLGAFFPHWTNLDSLQFNSLLLNTIVVFFALGMSVFCRDFFGFSKKITLLAIFFSVMSAGYVQAYCYYVLGQISTIPVFILFCIYLKRFLDQLSVSTEIKTMRNNLIILALLLNVLFIMYAILSFFALCLAGLSYLIVMRKQFKLRSFLPVVSAIILTVILFAAVRLLIIPESIDIFKSWISLSNRVAEGSKQGVNIFIVCSEYLTESVFALLFGLANYPSTNSMVGLFAKYDVIRISSLAILGVSALLITMLILRRYNTTNSTNKSGSVIVTTLFGITLILTVYFFFTLSGYGIYKLQTWFMPILLPLYVYFFTQLKTNKSTILLKIGALTILMLNVIAGSIYLNDFFLPGTKQGFVNARGITGNKDIKDIAEKLKQYNASDVSLFLTNGLETAWLSDLLRNTNLDKVTHNAQPLIEKDFEESNCKKLENKNWRPSRFIVITNPNLMHSDILSPPTGGNLLYANRTFQILDSSNLQTLIYLGNGIYPVEYFPRGDDSFPSKFRWAEKGVEVLIYSDKEKMVALDVELTPGYVDNKNLPRNFVIKTNTNEHRFSITMKKRLTINQVQLHQGLNCLTVESPDNVERFPRYSALIRPHIPLDARLNNFAISYVGIKN